MTSSDGPVPTVACATCGTAAVAGERFCRHCGTPLSGALPPPTAEHDPGRPRTAPSDVEATTQTMAAVASEVGTGRRDPGPGAREAASVSSRATPTRSEGVACPSCAGVNPLGRELCARCGVDLETGRALPRPRPGVGEGSSNGSLLPATAHRAWWVAPLAVVGVAGALVAGLWAAGIGPFASEPELPPATFVAERYPVDDDPEQLVLSDVATLTTRPPEGQRTFPVEQMVDTDPATAWHSHPPDLPDGVGEKIDLFLEDPAWVSQLIVNNGDHADSAAYEAAGRIQRATLVMDGDVRMDVVLLDLGRDPQAVTLPEPVLTTTVRLEVIEALPGSASESLAISDLELRGWPADETDADVALRRADVNQAAGSFTLPG